MATRDVTLLTEHLRWLVHCLDEAIDRGEEFPHPEFGALRNTLFLTYASARREDKLDVENVA